MKLPWTRIKRRIYLDHAAATPVHPLVQKAMQPFLADCFANPSAIHKEGVQARQAVEEARQRVAQLLGVRETGVTFTSGGTESNHLALVGVVDALCRSGEKSYSDLHIISTKVEHPSVLETLRQLEERGVEVTYLGVTEAGFIDPRELTAALKPQTALVTFAYANSETGVVQEVKRLSRIVRKYNEQERTATLVHLDASQAPLWLPCQLPQLGVQLMTLDAGKCCGPKGLGVLARTHGIDVGAQLRGGDQERGVRAGTENVAGIVGCAVALQRAFETQATRVDQVRQVRNQALEKLLALPGVVLNGSEEQRLANNINISISGIDSEYLVIVLDSKGVAASTKSACSGASGSGSTVVRAMTGDEDRATSTVRLTLGEHTTREDLAHAIGVVSDHLNRYVDTGLQ